LNIAFKQCNAANYTPGRTKAIQYLVIHYTANNGDSANNNAVYFAYQTPGASAHYFVDENDTIWQSVKDTDTAWHCGATTYKHASCRNNNSIGIELCSRQDSAKNYYFKANTVTNAVALTKELMAKYGIPAENVIRHYDVTGKNCPAPFVGDSAQWREFKARLEAEEVTQEQFENMYATMIAKAKGDKPSSWAKEICEAAKEAGIFRGDGTGSYNWQDPITREALASVLKNAKLF